jgi:transmembrane sensor
MEEAASWLAAMDAGTASPDAFEAWRGADPRHAAAFAQVADAFEQIERLRAVHEREPTPSLAWNRRKMLRAGVLAGGASIAGALVAVKAAAREKAETTTGERRTLLLEDGTRVRMNTATRIRWKIGAGDRTIWLERGEIGLDVAKEFGSPFRIQAADGTVFGLSNGSFNIRQEQESFDLLTLIGRAEAEGGGQESVAAGSLARVIGRHVVIRVAEPVALDRARSWRDGQLVFEGESLDFVVAEFNRYLDPKIVIADPSLSRIRLGGRFTTTDPKDLLTALHASFGIRAVRSESGAITLTAD